MTEPSPTEIVEVVEKEPRRAQFMHTHEAESEFRDDVNTETSTNNTETGLMKHPSINNEHPEVVQSPTSAIKVSFSDDTSSTTGTTSKEDTRKILQMLRASSRTQYHQVVQQKKGLLHRKYLWTLLTLCGFWCGVITFAHDQIIKYMFQGRLTMIDAFDPQQYFGVRMILWILYNLFFMYSSALLVTFVAPTAEGSGIPAVKAILNGVPLKDPLHWKTLVIKVITLPAVLGTGMFFGKVGPSVHIGTMLMNNLLNLRIFKPIKKVKDLRHQMLTCGCVSSMKNRYSNSNRLLVLEQTLEHLLVVCCLQWRPLEPITMSACTLKHFMLL